MEESSGALVVWVLAPLFLAVGLYLVWYSQRRKKMLEAFANTRQLQMRLEFQEPLQKKLDDCFSLENKNLVRSFNQLSSIVDGGSSIWVFRAVELLDLNPHGQTDSTHFSRIIALFDVSTDSDEFFVLDKSLRVRVRLPDSEAPGNRIVEIAKQSAAACGARHALSVTLRRGCGLIYFEPLVTGGERAGDVDSLYCIAKKMREELS